MVQKDEPSMEEILSSIKRIIAEDSDALPARRARPEPADVQEEEPDVLELNEPVGEFQPFVAPEATQDLDSEPEQVDQSISVEEAPAIAHAPVAPESPAISAGKGSEALLSDASAEATRQALAALSRLVVKPLDPAGDNTLEGLVREILRPMLKEWLDANLPGIVQATVDREVARISGRTL